MLAWPENVLDKSLNDPTGLVSSNSIFNGSSPFKRFGMVSVIGHLNEGDGNDNDNNLFMAFLHLDQTLPYVNVTFENKKIKKRF